MKRQKRWMKTVIEESKKEAPALPFDRTHRKTSAMRQKHALKRAAA